MPHLTMNRKTGRLIYHATYPAELPIRYMYFEDEAMYYGEGDHHIRFFSYFGPDCGFGEAVFTLPMLRGPSHCLIGPFSGSVADVNRFRLWQQYPGSKQPVVSVLLHGTAWFLTYDYVMSLPRHGDFNIVCYSGDIKYQSWQQVPKDQPFTLEPVTCTKL